MWTHLCCQRWLSTGGLPFVGLTLVWFPVVRWRPYRIVLTLTAALPYVVIGLLPRLGQAFGATLSDGDPGLFSITRAAIAAPLLLLPLIWRKTACEKEFCARGGTPRPSSGQDTDEERSFEKRRPS